MYERLYITESKLRVHLDSPLLKERRVFLEENANMGKSKDRLRILASYIFTLRMLCIYTTGKMIYAMIIGCIIQIISIKSA